MLQNNSKSLSLTKGDKQILQEPAISDEAPGSILKDFDTMLDIIGEKGMETGGKYSFFPMGKLAEMNSQLTHSIHLNLQRPQQKSFPHVNGLYLLLRSTGIVFPKNIGKKRVLVPDETILQSWRGLNFTEKYFTLLEAWLLQGNEEILREPSRGFPNHLWKCKIFWSRNFDKGKTFKPNQKRDEFNYVLEWYNLALLQMFGFITIKPVSKKVKKFWLIEQIQPTDFGNVMIPLLYSVVERRGIKWKIFPAANLKFGEWQTDSQPVFSAWKKQFGEWQTDSQPVLPEWKNIQAKNLQFGEWQTDLQSVFPEWKNNLITMETKFQEGVHVFKVALGRVWRRIAISGTHNFELLSDAILEAFNFDHDHLYQFDYSNRKGLTFSVNAPQVDEVPFTTEVQVGSLGLNPGESMDYIFDFGDYWKFTIILETVESDNNVISKPAILESHGEAPEQYGY